jgi:beta-lactamase regulating signal transducer with metallopeptidase domain
MTALVPAGALEGAALAIFSYIVDSLWQGVLVVLLAAAAIRVFRRANATTRYAIWYIALIAVIALPAVTVGGLAAAQHRTAVATAALASAPSPVQANDAVRARSHPAGGVLGGPARETGAAPSAQVAGPHFERPRIALPSAVSLIVAALWIAGALYGLLRIAIGYVALAKLQRDALPLPPAYRDGMPLWEESAQRGGRETRLCVSSHVPVPVAVGLFDGMILMPDHLLSSFDRADVDRFSLHEMAHLQRRDDWTCAFERIACAVLFFNPAVRWIARQLDLEREVACDDWVVSQTHEVRPYAVGLTKMAEATPWPHRPVPTPAIFASRKSISIRIERLLNKHRDVRPTIAGGPAAACGIAILAVSLVLLPVAPVIGNAVTPAAPAVVTHVTHSTAPVHVHATTVAHKLAAHEPAARKAVPTTVASAMTKPHTARSVIRTAPPAVASVAAAKPRIVAAGPAAVLRLVQKTTGMKRSPSPPTVVAFHVSGSASDVPVPSVSPKVKFSYSYSLTSSRSKSSPLSVSSGASASPSASASASVSAGAAASARSGSSAAAFGTSSARVDLLDALNTAGYQKLSADEIIALHDNGVGGNLIIAAAKYFDHRATVAEIVTMARSGISSRYLDDLGQHGVHATPPDVVRFLQSGVSAAYAGALQHAISGLSSSSIVELAQHGVSSRLVIGLKERGYDATAPAIVEFASHGVPLSYVDAVNARRNPKFSLDEIVKLHDRGVSANAI